MMKSSFLTSWTCKVQKRKRRRRRSLKFSLQSVSYKTTTTVYSVLKSIPHLMSTWCHWKIIWKRKSKARRWEPGPLISPTNGAKQPSRSHHTSSRCMRRLKSSGRKARSLHSISQPHPSTNESTRLIHMATRWTVQDITTVGARDPPKRAKEVAIRQLLTLRESKLNKYRIVLWPSAPRTSLLLKSHIYLKRLYLRHLWRSVLVKRSMR